jgi:aryl-alcohol dehydrogenase-like predicted oxidoreductase
MEKRRLGKTDMKVGTLGFGGSEIHDEHASYATIERLLHQALDDGLNVIDTAECYGPSEEFIGRAVGNRRDMYYLFTKCGHAAGLDLPDWDARLLEQSVERSLRRLQTEYVDLVQLHSCSEEVLRQGEVIDVLQRLRDAGKTRYIGYSGDGQAAQYAIQCGAFDTLQTSINIVDQTALEGILPLAREQGMGVIAKRPLANAVWRYGTTAPTWTYHYVYLGTIKPACLSLFARRFPGSG